MPWVPTNEIVQDQIAAFTDKGDLAYAAAMAAIQAIQTGFNNSPAAIGVRDGIAGPPDSVVPPLSVAPLPPVRQFELETRTLPGSGDLPPLPDYTRHTAPSAPNATPDDIAEIPPPPDIDITNRVREYYSGLGNPPEFIDAPPTITIPPPPTVTPPVRPPNPTPLVMPEYPIAPTLEGPSEPTLIPITLPDFAPPDLSHIRATIANLRAEAPVAPELPGMIDPAGRLNHYLEMIKPGVVDDVLAGLVPALKMLLTPGSKGISDATAALMRARAFAAEDTTARQALEQMLADWNARGFTLPGGALEAGLKEVRQLNRDKKAQLNRDVWIEEAKQEIENLRFAIQQGIAYEAMHKDALGKLFDVAARMAALEVDAWKALLDGTVEIFQAKVTIWKEKFSTFRDEIQAEIAILDLYKTELEGQKLIGQLNQQAVELYRARWELLSQKVGLYKVQVDAVNGILQGELGKLEYAAKEIQLYTADISAFEAQWNAHGKAIQVEASKAELFNTLAQVFGKRIDAWAKTADVANSQAATETAALNSQIQLWATHIERRKADLQAETARIDALFRGFAAEVQSFSANVQAEGDYVNLGVKRIDAAIAKKDYALKELDYDLKKTEIEFRGMEVGLKEREQELQNREFDLKVGDYELQVLNHDLNKYRIRAEIKLQDASLKQTLALETSKLAVSAMDGIARVAAQLSGSAMSAMNVSASLGSNSNSSYTESHNYSYQM